MTLSEYQHHFNIKMKVTAVMKGYENMLLREASNLPEVMLMVNPDEVFRDSRYKETKYQTNNAMFPEYRSSSLSPAASSSTTSNSKHRDAHLSTTSIPKYQQRQLRNIPASQNNPCMLKTAQDFVQRIALTSYLLRKKLPKQTCLSCEGKETPSRILSQEEHKYWDLQLPINRSSPSLPETPEKSSPDTQKTTQPFGNRHDKGNCVDAMSLKFAAMAEISTIKERLEAQESLLQQSIAEQLEEYACFPVVTTKCETIKEIFSKDKLTNNRTVQSSNKQEDISTIRLKLVDTNRKRRPLVKPRKPDILINPEPDLSIQNTVDYFMNMSSPIKITNMNEPHCDSLVRRSLINELNDSYKPFKGPK